jgi:hypothetical protein
MAKALGDYETLPKGLRQALEPLYADLNAMIAGVCQDFEGGAMLGGYRTGGMIGTLKKTFIMAGFLARLIPR